MKELDQNFINIIKFYGFFGSNGLGSRVMAILIYWFSIKLIRLLKIKYKYFF